MSTYVSQQDAFVGLRHTVKARRNCEGTNGNVFDYTERFYNRRLTYSTLNFVDPIQFEHGLMDKQERPGNPGEGHILLFPRQW